MKLLFPNPIELRCLHSLPTLAVDLGFGATRSCGIAASSVGYCPRHTSFGDCVSVVADFVSTHSESLVVIEAPLSCLFDGNGDPIHRDFEAKMVDGKLRRRPWYMQGGAAMALAAITLFRQLSSRIPPAHQIHVIEGYLTFKTRRSKHAKDAEDLLTEVHSTSAKWLDVSPTGDHCALNLLALAQLAPVDSPCPSVLEVKQS